MIPQTQWQRRQRVINGQRELPANAHYEALDEQDKDDQRKLDSVASYLSAHNVYYVK